MFTTNTISAHRHPLFRGFLSGKRHAVAIWAVSVYSLSCVARTEAFLMASNTTIIRCFGLASMLLSHVCLFMLRLDI